jgi:hypothetical protein
LSPSEPSQLEEIASGKPEEKTQEQAVVEEHLKNWILNSVETQQELDLEALQESTNVEYARFPSIFLS